jgi:hypothetical protein
MGNVVLGGRPAVGTVVGICQLDRGAESFVGADRVAADSAGRFIFFNIVPNDSHVLFAETWSVVPYWVPAETLKVAGTGTSTDAGTLHAEQGATLTGRVLLSDGHVLPPTAKVIFHRFPARDHYAVPIDASGLFVFHGAPRETCEVSFGITGYRSTSEQTIGLMRVFPDGQEVQIRLDPVNR